MKTLLLFLILPNLVYAQTWAPIGAKWTYTLGTINSNYTTFKTFESVGDTVIAGQSCKVLTIIEHYGPAWSDTTEQYTYSDSNKVYFYNLSS